MDLEKLIKLVLSNPDNISIEYSNIDGKETLIVNGEELSSIGTYDDTEIKRKIQEYKENIKQLDDCIFSLIIDEAEKRELNLSEMNRCLELEHYSEEDAEYANRVIHTMTEIITYVIYNKINYMNNLLDLFNN